MIRRSGAAIVLIEESPAFPDSLAMRLVQACPGHEVLCTTSLGQALEWIDVFDVRLLISELDTDDSDGLDTLNKLRKRTDRPVVVYSRLMAFAPMREQVQKLGFEDYFDKSEGSNEALIERVECLLEV